MKPARFSCAVKTVSLSALLSVCFPSAGFADTGSRTDSLLHLLDKAVDERAAYETKRLARIEVLDNRNQVLDPFSVERYDANTMLFREYRQYQCDSAIVYLNLNMDIAERLGDGGRLIETKLLLASHLDLAGMYKESVDLLESIDANRVPAKSMLEYLFCHRQVFWSLAYHTKDRRQAAKYRETTRRYDSLALKAAEGRSDEFALMVAETCWLDAGMYDEAMRNNDERLARAKEGSAEYAHIAYHRAMNYKGRNDPEMEKQWLALSALSDMRSAIRDYASLWMLAETLFKEGDVERAYRYIRVSWDDTELYDARLRRLQTAGILTMIDETYNIRLREKIDAIRRNNVVIGLLAIVLAVAFVLIYVQKERLRAVRDELQKMNGRLASLNDELMRANDSLRLSNANLSESNLIKEKYIGHFLSLCSAYIDKLDAFRRTVHRKLRDGQTADLMQTTAPQEHLDADMKEFYANFDTTFLQIFPDFVTRFNDLLNEDEAVVPKKNELLNTELRIFALIRLGIDDSTDIAEFLRYSLNTIYNYRAKVRNKARGSRDEFEDQVRRIR